MATLRKKEQIQTLFSTKSRQALTSGVKEEVPDRSVFFKHLSESLKKNRNHFHSKEREINKR